MKSFDVSSKKKKSFAGSRRALVALIEKMHIYIYICTRIEPNSVHENLLNLPGL